MRRKERFGYSLLGLQVPHPFCSGSWVIAVLARRRDAVGPVARVCSESTHSCGPAPSRLSTAVSPKSCSCYCSRAVCGSLHFGVRYFFMHSFNQPLNTCRHHCRCWDVAVSETDGPPSPCLLVELVTRNSKLVITSHKCCKENKAG